MHDRLCERLEESQILASLPYVCYERSLFHYLSRNNGIQLYPLFHLFRSTSLYYVPEANEALQYHNDGYGAFISSFETIINLSNPDEIVSRIGSELARGCQIRIMLLTTKPDGSQYVTSSLIEEAVDDGFLITKTNETESRTKLWYSREELIGRIPRDSSGQLNASLGCLCLEDVDRDGWASHTLPEFIDHLLELDNQVTSARGSLMKMSILASEFEKFVDSAQVIDYHNLTSGQKLKLNKHITNKLEPIIKAWEYLLLHDDHALIPDADRPRVQYAVSQYHAAYKELSKRFILLAGAPSQRAHQMYCSALTRVFHEFLSFASTTELVRFTLLQRKEAK